MRKMSKNTIHDNLNLSKMLSLFIVIFLLMASTMSLNAFAAGKGSKGDTFPPSGNMLINNNADITKAASVTLNISATDNKTGVKQMIISNDLTFASAVWVAYAATYNWTLTAGDGYKTVYIKFKDGAGNVSIVYNDGIMLSSTVTDSKYINLSTDGLPGDIATDKLGNTYIAYYRKYNTYYHLFVKKSEDGGLTWKYWNGTAFDTVGTETPIENTGNYDEWDPTIAIDSKNNIHIAWSGITPASPYTWQIRYTKFNGISWSTPTEITDNPNWDQYDPELAIDSNDNLHLAWDGYSTTSTVTIQVRYSKFNGTSWSVPINLTNDGWDQSYPAIAIDKNNNVHIMWDNDTFPTGYISSYAPQIRYRMFNGTTWSTTVDVTKGIYGQYYPQLAVDGNGVLHAAWYGESETSPSVYQLRYTKLVNGAWTAPVNITNEKYDQFRVNMAIDASNNIYFVWYGYIDAAPAVQQIRYAKYTGGLLTPTNITSGTFKQSWPIISQDGLKLLWQGLVDSKGVSVSNSGTTFYNVSQTVPATPTAP